MTEELTGVWTTATLESIDMKAPRVRSNYWFGVLGLDGSLACSPRYFPLRVVSRVWVRERRECCPILLPSGRAPTPRELLQRVLRFVLGHEGIRRPRTTLPCSPIS